MIRLAVNTLVVALLLNFATADHVHYHPKRTHLVDIVGKNFFFRGNNPLNETSFLYDELLKDFARVAKDERGVELPSSLYLIDISLLNVIYEKQDVHMEQSFFKEHSDLGQFMLYPTYGDLTAPHEYPKPLRNFLAKKLEDWQLDRSPHRVDAIRAILEKQGNVSIAVYIHCEAGTDRTGEMVGDYLMKYGEPPLNKSLKAVLEIDDHIISRDIKFMSRNGLEWFCWYLREGEGRDIDCSLD